MKKLVLLLFLLSLFSISAPAQTSSPKPADQGLKDACRLAAKENKNVFIIFHASWCGWRRPMDSTMNSASCKDLFQSQYVIRRLDVLE